MFVRHEKHWENKAVCDEEGCYEGNSTNVANYDVFFVIIGIKPNNEDLTLCITHFKSLMSSGVEALASALENSN